MCAIGSGDHRSTALQSQGHKRVGTLLYGQRNKYRRRDGFGDVQCLEHSKLLAPCEVEPPS